MKSTAEGARTSILCAADPELAASTGRYYANCREKRASRHADETLARELWDRSAAWVGLGPALA